MLTYDTAISLRIEEEKECLIYFFFTGHLQPPPPPPPATPNLNKLIFGRPVLKTINDGYIHLSFLLKTNTTLFL